MNEPSAETHTETAVFEAVGDGLVVFRARPGAAVGLEQARDNNRVIAALGGGAGVRVLADIRQLRKMDRAARAYSSEIAGEQYAAVALLVGGPVSRVIGSFFLGINSPEIPTRVFDDEAAARAWLESLAGEG